MNRSYKLRIPAMNHFEFEEKIAAGVFELRSFLMPQIPGFEFSIRICENKHLALPDRISHYFSVQLCVKKGPRKSEVKMRSELSDFQLEGTLNLTQNFGRWKPHCMRGVIFKPNVYEEQQEKITTELLEYDTYEYNPKTSRPAFVGWHFGTKKTNFTDYHKSHTVVDDSDFDNSTWSSEWDVYRDFCTIGTVHQLKIEVTIDIMYKNSILATIN